jgi:hypothetical protein
VTGQSALGFIFQNNISYNPTAGGYHAYLEGVVDKTDLLMSHNGWYPDTAGSSNRFAWMSADQANFAGFVSAATAAGASAGSNSFTLNPLFTDAANGNLTLRSGSPCLDSGINLGASYDDALKSDSVWPQAVHTLSQDACGAGWERGIYAYEQAGAGTYALTMAAQNYQGPIGTIR